MSHSDDETPDPRRFPSRELLAWYRRHRRTLPWRESPNPYHVWLSEVMLQQTRVETVVPYFYRFLARFPRLEDLAVAREEDVLALWSGLGYYRRARSLRAGAQHIAARHGGAFPDTLEAALAVPGVGAYTAAAVLSIAFGLPHPVLDGNVERVLSRFLRTAGNPRRADTVRRMRSFLAQAMPDGHAGDFNQALMELGATVCKPLAPCCGECPLAHGCGGLLHGDAQRFPELPPRRAAVDVEVEMGILEHGGRYVLERARGHGFLEGLWLFPFAVISTSPRTGLRAGGAASRVAELCDADVREIGRLEPMRHAITFRRLRVTPVLLASDAPGASGRAELRWEPLAALGAEVPVSSLCLKVARKIAAWGLLT